MAKHQFTTEETKKGAASSARARRGIIKQIKKLTGMELDAQNLQTVIEMFTVWIATPIGQAIFGAVMIKGLERLKIFAPVDAQHFLGLILSVEVIGAIGGTNLIPQIASLGAALKGPGGLTASKGIAPST